MLYLINYKTGSVLCRSSYIDNLDIIYDALIDDSDYVITDSPEDWGIVDYAR